MSVDKDKNTGTFKGNGNGGENPSQTAKTGAGEANPENSVDTTLAAELDKAKKDHLYLLAEFDNYRKNAIKERSDLMKFGSERFIREFLTVFDNFERALESDPAQTGNLDSSFRQGVRMIADEFKSLLQRSGVEEVKAEGEPFDPSKHEALGNEPRSDLPPGHVARVFKKAYKMHDRLIRPAQVLVAVAAAGKPQQEN